MKRFSLKSLKSGLILGEILELVLVDGQLEYVVQNGTKRFFVKHGSNVTLTQ